MFVACLRELSYLLEISSASWVRRVYRRLRLGTLTEIVRGVLWVVRGLPELDDKMLAYTVWRSGNCVECSCMFTPWGYSRSPCTHIGAVLAKLLSENNNVTCRITLIRKPLSKIVRIEQSCRPVLSEIKIGNSTYTMIMCSCGLCDEVEIAIGRELESCTCVRRRFVKVSHRFIQFLSPELAKYVT